MDQCQLTYMKREPIQYDLAVKQHKDYQNTLEHSGVRVVVLDHNNEYPDSSFVEDTAIVFKEVAVLTSMGTQSRRGESEAIERELTPYRAIARVELPATIEGGDVIRFNHRVYVGQSTRTNRLGFEAMRDILTPYGYEVFPVNVHGALHLKTACTRVNDQTLIANPDWVDLKPFRDVEILEVPSDEPWAGNVLSVNGHVIIHEEFTKTIEMLQSLGHTIQRVNISEYLKAEAGLTCMSVIFPDRPPEL